MAPNTAVTAGSGRKSGAGGRKTGRGVRTLVVVGALIVGGAGGALGIRHHLHNASETVATVDGAPITSGVFYGRLMQKVGTPVIRQMVDEELQLQFAKKIGVAPSDAEVNALYAEESKRPAVARLLAARPSAAAELKQQVRAQLIQVRILSKGAQPTGAEARKFYEQNIDPKNPRARYYTPETATIDVIITRTKADAATALKAIDGGMSFPMAAAKYSKDRSAASGGVVGPFGRGRVAAGRIPGFEDAIFALAPGQQMGPRQFAGAWWIIRCIDKKPAVTEPYESVKEDSETSVSLTKAGPGAKSTAAKFADFRKQSTIQAFWPELAPAIGQ